MTADRMRVAAICLVATLVAGGCGSSTSPRVVATGTSLSAKRALVLHQGSRARAKTRIDALVASLAADYSASHWRAVRALFSSFHAANSMVSQLVNWRTEGVPGLRAEPISLSALGSRRYVVTIEFQSDPRAIPVYDVYTVVPSSHGLVFSDQASGIRASSAQSGSWDVIQTKHYRVYHSPYELVGSDRRFLADLEYERAMFVSKFGIQPPKLARYYYYPRQNLMSSFTGGVCGSTAELVGCTLPDKHPPEIHTSEWPSYHEPIHVFQVAMEPRKYQAPLFISEGMAVALEDRELDPRLSDYCSDLAYVPLDECAAHVVASMHPLSLLSDRGFSRGDVANSYLAGGSFVKYLILTYGYHRFGRFYYLLAAQPGDSTRDYNVAAQRVYGTTIESLLTTWRGALCGGGQC